MSSCCSSACPHSVLFSHLREDWRSASLICALKELISRPGPADGPVTPAGLGSLRPELFYSGGFFCGYAGGQLGSQQPGGAQLQHAGGWWALLPLPSSWWGSAPWQSLPSLGWLCYLLPGQKEKIPSWGFLVFNMYMHTFSFLSDLTDCQFSQLITVWSFCQTWRKLPATSRTSLLWMAPMQNQHSSGNVMNKMWSYLIVISYFKWKTSQ